MNSVGIRTWHIPHDIIQSCKIYFFNFHMTGFGIVGWVLPVDSITPFVLLKKYTPVVQTKENGHQPIIFLISKMHPPSLYALKSTLSHQLKWIARHRKNSLRHHMSYSKGINQVEGSLDESESYRVIKSSAKTGCHIERVNRHCENLNCFQSPD